jgi:hypothetical protein
MMKRLTKTCLAALLCSTALNHALPNVATAQQQSSSNESRINLRDFVQMDDLPVNPLPGESESAGSGSRNIPSGPVLSRPGTESTRRSTALPQAVENTTTVAQPPSAIEGSSVEGSSVDAKTVSAGDSYFDEEVYDGEVYEGIVEGEIYDVHTVIGLSALGFRRNYGEDRLLSNNFTDRGDTLTTSDSDHGQIGGFEAYINCRSSSGVGWEFRYFGFAPSENTATLGNDPTTVLVGLNDIAETPGGPSVADIFADGNFHSVTRDSSIYNFEFNFLRNHNNIGWFNGILGNTESIVGFRYFDFDESLQYASGSDSGTGPRSVSFNSAVENSLFGLQVGGRSEFNLFRKINGSVGLKVGGFYTRARSNRSITGRFADGRAFDPSIQNGTTSVNGFDFSSGENDISFLAELDLGLIYQLSQSSRLRFGYRRIGISGLAFASNNIPDDLANTAQLNETNDSQALRLRGIYFSYELAF